MATGGIVQAKLNIIKIKVVVVGDPGVGKTSLIKSFQDNNFTPDLPEGNEEVAGKMIYVTDERVVFEMVELHDETTMPESTSGAQAVLLLYDSEERATQRAVREKWYSRVNLHFAHVPLFLVRTKMDISNDFTHPLGKRLADAVHAEKFLVCSAKQMNGIKYVFLEVYLSIKAKLKKLAEAESTNTFGSMFNLVSSSGPLLKQAMVNVRECINNPSAFTEQKRNITSYLPFLDFGLKDDPKVKAATPLTTPPVSPHANQTKKSKSDTNLATNQQQRSRDQQRRRANSEPTDGEDRQTDEDDESDDTIDKAS